MFQHFNYYWRSPNDHTEYVLYFGEIISFPGMKWIRNWFGMGCEGGTRWLQTITELYATNVFWLYLSVSVQPSQRLLCCEGRGGRSGCNIRPREEKNLNPNTIIKTLVLSSTLSAHTTLCCCPCPSLSAGLSLLFSKITMLPFQTTRMRMKNQQIKSYINPTMTFPT